MPARNAEYQREYRARHPERVKDSQRRSYLKHKEARRARYLERRAAEPEHVLALRRAADKARRARQPIKERERHIRRRYGLEPQDLATLIDSQGCACPGCGVSVMNGRVHIDHCHATGVVRGVLCQFCNHALGLGRDDPTILRALADYVEKTA